MGIKSERGTLLTLIEMILVNKLSLELNLIIHHIIAH